MTSWLRLKGTTEIINLFRVRSIACVEKQVIFRVHTEVTYIETYDTEAEAGIRFGQVMSLLGAAQ